MFLLTFVSDFVKKPIKSTKNKQKTNQIQVI